MEVQRVCGPDESCCRIYYDSIISLSHLQESAELLSDFEVRALC